MKQDTAPISNTMKVSDSLIERAMLTLDDYLNAGCKETRKQAAENGKFQSIASLRPHLEKITTIECPF
jgi:hypothetical protein